MRNSFTKQIKPSPVSKKKVDLQNNLNIKKNSDFSHRKIPISPIVTYKIPLRNTNHLIELKKNHIKLVGKFLLDMGHDDHLTEFNQMLEVFRRFKCVDIFSFYTTRILPEPGLTILTKLKSSTRGISIPILTREFNQELLYKTKFLKKFKLLKALRLEFTRVGQTEYSFKNIHQATVFQKHMMSLKYIKCFYLEEKNYQVKSFVLENISRILMSWKNHLTDLRLKIGNIEASSDKKPNSAIIDNLFGNISKLTLLSSLFLSMQDQNLLISNLQHLANCLSNNKIKDGVILKIEKGNALNNYMCLNAIHNLKLYILMSLDDHNPTQFNKLGSFKFPICIDVNGISRPKYEDLNFMKSFGKTIHSIQKLEGFSFYENINLNSRVGKTNLIEILPNILSNDSHLKRLNFFLANTHSLDKFLILLVERITNLRSLNHFEFTILTYLDDSLSNNIILKLISKLNDLPSLKKFYFSLDGNVVTVSFISKLIEKITSLTNLVQVGTLCMKATKKQSVEFYQRLSKMPNLESCIVWLSPLSRQFSNRYEKYDISLELFYELILECLRNFKIMKAMNITFPFIMTEAQIADFKSKAQIINKYLSLDFDMQNE